MSLSIPITSQTIVSASSNQVSSELAGEVVILNITAGVYHGLQETGARVWQLIQQPTRVGDLHESIVREFDVDPARCEADLLELLIDLRAQGLLTIHVPPTL